MSKNNDEASLNENGFISIINEFYNYRKQLSEKIKSPEIVLSKEECYLIEKSSIDELEEGFNKFNTLINKNKLDNYNYFKLIPKDFIFINIY